MISEIKSTDKMVSKGIFMSASAIYTHTKTAKVIALMIKRSLPEFRKQLDLPRDVQFRVAPIKAKNTNGYYMVEGKLAVIDCRLGWAKALEVIAHELVHAEQYHTGKLKKKYIQRKGWLHHWNGTPGKKGTTYKAYRDQPWEQEAWNRQMYLAETVCRILEEKYV
jgi:hypothetical protein